MHNLQKTKVAMSTEVQKTDGENSIQVVGGNLPDIDSMKSMYYWLNARPDLDIKILEKKRRINIADIRSINDRVVEKLNNHKVVNSITSIIFTLSNKRIKQYGAWAEFERENWDTINARVTSIAIDWDITVQMPHHALPQKHKLKLQLGDEIAPKDVFTLMSNSESMADVRLQLAYGTVRVDFINQVLANELIELVTNWYNGLLEIEEQSWALKSLQKYKSLILNVIGNSFTLLFLFLLFSYVSIWGPYSENLTIGAFTKYGVFIFLIIVVGVFCGRLAAGSIDKRINKLRDYSGFIISKGDKNHHEKVKKENKSILGQILLRITLGVASGIASVVGKLILESYIKK